MKYPKQLLVLAGVFSIALACTSAGGSNNAPNVAASTPQDVRDGSFSPTPRPDDGVPRITLADAKKDFDADAAVFVDTRTAEQFEQGHIPGAVNLSYTDIAAGKGDKLPKGKKIITYCS